MDSPRAATYSIGERRDRKISQKDSTHREAADYQAAKLALFSNEKPSLEANNQGQDGEQPIDAPNFEWFAHIDGYHYKKMNDGKLESTPYVKNSDGDYVPTRESLDP